MSEAEQHDSGSPGAGEIRDRRRWARAPGAFTAAIGRARLLPRLSHHYPSLRPSGWYKVIGRNPESLEPRVRQGQVWIEVDGRPRQVWGGHFELQVDGPEREAPGAPGEKRQVEHNIVQRGILGQ